MDLLWIHFLYLIRPFLSGFQLLSLNAIYLKCDFCTILFRLDKGHSIEWLRVNIFCVLLLYTAHALILCFWGPWRGQDGVFFISVYNMKYGLSSSIKKSFSMKYVYTLKRWYFSLIIERDTIAGKPFQFHNKIEGRFETLKPWT